MKKLLAGILSIAMLCTSQVILINAENYPSDVSVSANEEVAAENNVAIEFDTKSITTDTRWFSVPVRITENSGITSLNMDFEYDTSILEMTGISISSTFTMDENYNTIGNIERNYKHDESNEYNNKILGGSIAWNSVDNQVIKTTDKFINVCFKIVGDITSSTVFEITANATASNGEDTFTPSVSSGLISFDDSKINDPLVKFSCSDDTVQPGGIAYVDVSVNDNQGFSIVLFHYIFDTDIFSLENVYMYKKFDYELMGRRLDENGNEIIEKLHSWQVNPVENLMIWCATGLNTYENGNFVRLTLKVADDAPEGEYSIIPNGEQCASEDYYKQSALITSEAGTIIVTNKKEDSNKNTLIPLNMRLYADINGNEVVAGDVDNDGKTDSYDALMILENVVGVKEADIKADINEDSEITSSDALDLLQYIVK